MRRYWSTAARYGLVSVRERRSRGFFVWQCDPQYSLVQRHVDRSASNSTLWRNETPVDNQNRLGIAKRRSRSISHQYPSHKLRFEWCSIVVSLLPMLPKWRWSRLWEMNHFLSECEDFQCRSNMKLIVGDQYLTVKEEELRRMIASIVDQMKNGWCSRQTRQHVLLDL